jgi:uncharacterized protein
MSRVPSWRHRISCTALLLYALCAFWSAQAQFPTQGPQGYVNDFAGVLNPQGRQQLEALCSELEQKTNAQLAIVTVQSLQGRALEEFALDLATKWGIGHRPSGPRDERADRGVLLFLAIQDRRSRIEVGYGLEPIITDGAAGGILRGMTPYLRAGDYDGALWLGAVSIAQPIARGAGVTLASVAARTVAAPATRWEDEVLGHWLPIFLAVLFGVLFFVPMLLLLIPRRFRRRMGNFGTWVDSGGFSGGGGGWDGGGGGGFSGGGGSFGGGGASGSW